MIIRNNADIYRKIFLFSTIPSGLFIGIWYGWSGGLWHGVVAGIAGGLFYGFFMALTLGALHQFSTKHLKTDYSENLLGVHQVQVVTVQQPFKDAFTTCQQCLQELDSYKITLQDEELGVIRAQTRPTWKSFGEKIMFTVSPAGTDLCKITISSKPAIATTLVDYGKNAQNIRVIMDLLRKRTPLLEALVERDSTSAPQLSMETNTTDGSIQTGNTIKVNTEKHESA